MKDWEIRAELKRLFRFGLSIGEAYTRAAETLKVEEPRIVAAYLRATLRRNRVLTRKLRNRT